MIGHPENGDLAAVGIAVPVPQTALPAPDQPGDGTPEPLATTSDAAAGRPPGRGPRGASAEEVPAGGPFGLVAGWWPVAFSSEISTSPRGVPLGGGQIVVYRDEDRVARALTDRCPHRRVPLSMGTVTSAGLRCGYHGWVFDGASGRCTVIPDLGPQIPPDRIRVAAHPVVEKGGFVFVWSGSGAPGPFAPPLPLAGWDCARPKRWVARGVVEARAPHTELAHALVVNPGAALGLGWLLGGGDEMLGPHVVVDGAGVVARRSRLTWSLPRRRTYDPVSKRTTAATVAMTAATGMTVAVAETPAGREVAWVVIGLTPVGAYRTRVRWRVETRGVGGRLVAAICCLTAAGRLSAGRGTAHKLETAADASCGGWDPAVEALRELRAGLPVNPAPRR